MYDRRLPGMQIPKSRKYAPRQIDGDFKGRCPAAGLVEIVLQRTIGHIFADDDDLIPDDGQTAADHVVGVGLDHRNDVCVAACLDPDPRFVSEDVGVDLAWFWQL